MWGSQRSLRSRLSRMILNATWRNTRSSVRVCMWTSALEQCTYIKYIGSRWIIVAVAWLRSRRIPIRSRMYAAIIAKFHAIMISSTALYFTLYFNKYITLSKALCVPCACTYERRVSREDMIRVPLRYMCINYCTYSCNVTRINSARNRVGTLRRPSWKPLKTTPWRRITCR